jgi:predicted membrane chloride channel (bestrophin family)
MIWKLPFSKVYRKRLGFMVVFSLCLCVLLGFETEYINMLYLFPLSLVAVYLGFVLGEYLNKRADKKKANA